MAARTKDGRPLTVLLSNAHIELDGVPCFLNTGTDLTQRRLTEDALRRANQQKDEYLALLSHELRNPLTPILTSARLLERRVDPELHHDVDIIIRQVKHVSRLVDDLVDVARVTRGAVTLTKTRIEPATAIARAVSATSPLFHQRAHSLEIDVPERGLAVEADVVRLTQIFDNLLSNAALYMEPGGTVRVSARREGDLVTVRVRDRGIGIESRLLPEIFEIFAQGPRGADRAEGGLGVGLSLVRGLTELHGGTVTVHSDGPGLGSEFTVRLPAAASNGQRSPTPAHSMAALHEANGNATRILIVDDHRDVGDGLARLLRTLGYDARIESNPLDAVAAAEAFRPEIALLDIGLPVMDGYALAGEFRARLGSATPVLIALSGYNQPQDLRRGQAAGFAVHLVKPIDTDQLVATLDHFAPAR